MRVSEIRFGSHMSILHISLASIQIKTHTITGAFKLNAPVYCLNFYPHSTNMQLKVRRLDTEFTRSRGTFATVRTRNPDRFKLFKYKMAIAQ